MTSDCHNNLIASTKLFYCINQRFVCPYPNKKLIDSTKWVSQCINDKIISMLLFKSNIIICLCRSFVARRQRAGRPADESCEQHEQLEPGDSGEPAVSPAVSPAIGAGVNDDDDNTSVHSNGYLYRGGKTRRRGHPLKSGTNQPRKRSGGRWLCAQEKATSLQNDFY